MNRLGLKIVFNLDATYCVSMNINVLLIYQAFKGKFAKEEVAPFLIFLQETAGHCHKSKLLCVVPFIWEAFLKSTPLAQTGSD